MRAKGILFIVLLGLSGCFSRDDFSECTADDQCGAQGVCEENKCKERELPEHDQFTETMTDAAPPIAITGEIHQPNQNFPGDEIIIEEIKLIGIQNVVFTARKITIRGDIKLDGMGHPGGGGGGGGGGASVNDTITMGGAGGMAIGSAAPGASGKSNMGTSPGLGGAGGDGGGPGAGRGQIGQAGQDGRLNVESCNLGTELLVGSGGGGGGGGNGGVAGQCRGGGGGGGGAGGPGGPSLAFYADESIVFDGNIFARGLLGETHNPATDGVPGCVSCDSCAPEAGRGGQGGVSGERFGSGSTDGSPGGAGSGGSVIFQAPTVDIKANSSINVSGGNPGSVENNGLVAIFSDHQIGAPAIHGARLNCD